MSRLHVVAKAIAETFPEDLRLHQFDALLELNLRVPDVNASMATLRMPNDESPTVLWISNLTVNHLGEVHKKLLRAMVYVDGNLANRDRVHASLDLAYRFPENIRVCHINTEKSIFSFEVYVDSTVLASFELKGFNVNIDNPERYPDLVRGTVKDAITGLQAWAAQYIIEGDAPPDPVVFSPVARIEALAATFPEGSYMFKGRSDSSNVDFALFEEKGSSNKLASLELSRCGVHLSVSHYDTKTLTPVQRDRVRRLALLANDLKPCPRVLEALTLVDKHAGHLVVVEAQTSSPLIKLGCLDDFGNSSGYGSLGTVEFSWYGPSNNIEMKLPESLSALKSAREFASRWFNRYFPAEIEA
jgi:hypothetical protein